MTGDCAGMMCKAGVGLTPPSTLAEFTILSDGWVDTYDVELINGFNVPIEMKPKPGAAFASLSADTGMENFWCGNPGTTKPESPVSGASMAGWPVTGCGWQFSPLSPHYVKVTNGGTPCSTNAHCTESTEICGLPLETIRDNHSTTTTCGTFLGYWTPGQACSYAQGADQLPPFNCDTAVSGGPYGTLYHLYLCDLGSDSCYQDGTDTTCCGCATWDTYPFTKQCQHPNPQWVSEVKPQLDSLKTHARWLISIRTMIRLRLLPVIRLTGRGR